MQNCKGAFGEESFQIQTINFLSKINYSLHLIKIIKNKPYNLHDTLLKLNSYKIS